MKLKNSRFDSAFDAVVLVMVAFVMLIMLYPLYFILTASVSDPSAVTNGKTLFGPVGLNFKGYAMIFRNGMILTGYYNTIRYALFGTLIGLFVTIPAGYALSIPNLPGKRFVTLLMIFTMYFSGGFIPSYIVVKNLGLINTPYVLMIVGSFTVFNAVISRTFFATTIPSELREAAEIDGCSIGKFFVLVVLPLSKAIIAVIALYYASGHWNAYFSAVIYITKNSLYPLQLVLRNILVASQYSGMVSGSMSGQDMADLQNVAETIKYGVIVVGSLPIIMMYPFIQRYFVKGLMIGSLKG